MKLRITSGIAKNKKLGVPDIPGIRAVQEIMKLAIFSMIGDKIENSVCLDLFTGSGNLGLEALSRGAAWCDFVDRDPLAKQTVLSNIRELGFSDKTEFFLHDAGKYVASIPKRYDIIFIDPFYEDTAHKNLFKNLPEIMNKDALIFFLHAKNIDVGTLIGNSSLASQTERCFGASCVSVLAGVDK